MKKLLVTALILGSSTNVMADDYKYLTAKYNNEEKSIELASIRKITFEAGDVVVYTSEGQVKFPLSEMEKMFFSEAPTAIESMPMETASMKVSGGVLSVSGNGLLRIYSSNGQLQQMAKVDGSSRISLQNLPKGVYIINIGNQSIKFNK